MDIRSKLQKQLHELEFRIWRREARMSVRWQRSVQTNNKKRRESAERAMLNDQKQLLVWADERDLILAKLRIVNWNENKINILFDNPSPAPYSPPVSQ